MELILLGLLLCGILGGDNNTAKKSRNKARDRRNRERRRRERYWEDAHWWSLNH